jgi:hypothetical protein
MEARWMAELIPDDNEKRAVELLGHIKELAKLKFDSEEKREQSLLNQSSQMQTIFSFVSVTLLMLLPICAGGRSTIPTWFYFLATATTLLPLFLSLLFASIAQWRWKKKSFPDIDDLYRFFEEKYEEAESESQRLKQWITLVGDVQKSTASTNDRRIHLIKFQ